MFKNQGAAGWDGKMGTAEVLRWAGHRGPAQGPPGVWAWFRGLATARQPAERTEPAVDAVTSIAVISTTVTSIAETSTAVTSIHCSDIQRSVTRKYRLLIFL